MYDGSKSQSYIMPHCMTMEDKSDETMFGGKGGGRGGGGGGRGGGRGQGQRNGFQKNGRGNGNGNRKQGKGVGSQCDEISRCMQKTTEASGKQGPNDDLVPSPHINAIMESNLHVARKNVEWLRLALSGINLKTLEKARNSATPCVPGAGARAVDEVIRIHKELVLRIKDIDVQVRDMFTKMHVDMTSFRDGKNNVVDLTDSTAVAKLLLQGNLYYGGKSLRTMLFLENDDFKSIIYEQHAAKATNQGMPTRLTYGSADHNFAVSYETTKGSFELIFGLGADGRPIQPHVEKNGVTDHDYVILPSWAAEDLAAIDTRLGEANSSKISVLSTRSRASSLRSRRG